MPTHLVMMAIPYNLYERVKLLIAEWRGLIIDEEFAADITITVQFTLERFSPFQDALRELSHGRLEAEIVETNEATIMPVGAFEDTD